MNDTLGFGPMQKVKTIDAKKIATQSFLLGGCALLAMMLWSGNAHAQDPSQVDHYDQPYGVGYGDENRPYQASTRDENGNRVIVNGRFVDSNYSSSSGVGGSLVQGQWGSSFSASAIGNSLNVVTTGSWNTVIIDSTQINNGDQEADIVINGDIDLD